MLLIFLNFLQVCLAADSLVHLSLSVNVEPTTNSLAVHSEITTTEEQSSFEFTLNRSLEFDVLQKAKIKKLQSAKDWTKWQVVLPEKSRQLRIHYRGTVFDPVKNNSSTGLISAEGASLFASSFWYPQFQNSLYTFELKIRTPEKWLAVTNAVGVDEFEQNFLSHSHWVQNSPQDDLYLIAAKFRKYTNNQRSLVYLRADEPELAEKFLRSTESFLSLYSKWIGPYAYSKFSVVENFWETGFGMPGFTLLGPTVIRLPFLFYSSFPHEVLHNWWGNGVFIDYQNGNWAEGLTTYMADHYMQGQRGQDAIYRRTALVNFSNYVQEGRDFPLKDFRGRHNSSSQAVGYGKCMMVFHMLKQIVGKDSFDQSLRHFYRTHLFKKASWGDIQASFEDSTGKDLTGFFSQWLGRLGAPEISIESFSRSGNQMQITLKQSGELFDVQIPIHFFNEGTLLKTADVHLDQNIQSFQLEVPAGSSSVQVDPNFDVFRRVDKNEIPATLSKVLGHPDGVTFVLERTVGELEAAYLKAIEGVSKRIEGDVRVQFDNEPLPTSGALWFLGWNNSAFQKLTFKEDVKIEPSTLLIDGKKWSRKSVAPNVTLSLINQDQPVAWFAAHSMADMVILSRKISHYGKYSYVIFSNQQASRRGFWQVKDSPLRIDL